MSQKSAFGKNVDIFQINGGGICKCTARRYRIIYPIERGKYLSMMRESVKHRKARATHLAMLEDLVGLRKGGKQTYGSQIATPKDGEAYVEPLNDPDNVDKRRAAVGLWPLGRLCAALEPEVGRRSI